MSHRGEDQDLKLWEALASLESRLGRIEDRLSRLKCTAQAPKLPEGVTCLLDLGHEGRHEQKILMGPGMTQVIRWD